MQDTSPDFIHRAAEVAAGLPARIAANNARRDLDRDVIDQLHSAGLFSLLKPRRHGGLEGDPALFYDVQNVLAERCLSTAWVFGVLSIQAFVLSLFDQAAQDDVWGADPAALASSSFAPSGKVTRVQGGYRISGQWGWSSGSSFAQWALLGGLVPPASEGAAPQMRLFLVPRADYEIIDTWHSFGLRGTGSNDIRVGDAFVPEHRTLFPPPPLALSTDPERPALYRLPWLFMFASCVSNLAIGAGRGAVKGFLAFRSRQPGPINDAARLCIARAQSAVEAANANLQHNIGVLRTAAIDCRSLPAERILLYRSQQAAMVREIATHVDDLMLLTGGQGMRDGGPLTQTWLDLSAARHHMGNNPDASQLPLADALAGAFTAAS